MPKRMNATGEDRVFGRQLPPPIGGLFVAAGETVDVPDDIDAEYDWPGFPVADITAPAKKKA